MANINKTPIRNRYAYGNVLAGNTSKGLDMKAETVGLAMTTAPLMINILGLEAPALSMLVGLIAVIMTRVMMMTTDESKSRKGWWYYNVSLTLLLTLIVFVIILDRQLGPGTAVVLGIGVGASGILVVDVMKRWVLSFFAAWNNLAAPPEGKK